MSETKSEIKRDSRGRLLKGHSGNPAGRPKIVAAIRDLARKHGPEAFEKVVELLSSDNERVALAAAQELLNRAYGKPEQAHKLESEGLGPIVVLIEEGQNG